MKKLFLMQRLNTAADVKTELKYVYDAITLTRKTIDGKVPLIGFAGAPVSRFSFFHFNKYFNVLFI